ncbi:MAG: hypothetical protein LC656_10855, partial [Sphingomonadales bacterium]|nr:hypothetical protein [Sphingomonadales bacterium]
MHGLLLSTVQALILGMMPIVVLLPFIVAMEHMMPRTRYRLADRFPGVLFILTLPLVTILVAVPLDAVWRAYGPRPIVDLSAAVSAVVLFPLLLLVRDFLNYWQH